MRRRGGGDRREGHGSGAVAARRGEAGAGDYAVWADAMTTETDLMATEAAVAW
ncbi:MULTISPECIES: hypothetical protein [Streptomyces]|uniref:Uncharacterized protein n=1 Tax=Streptomyces caniscabiei TaxID=2746961 RepID=A0ABU4MM08_9ACTN|nr:MULTISPECIES: hypothetical protein [Streptomyces]MBE4735194.1 hypothetical protein [Streptomyces caniscabiei]MBE4754328.1 hypothetical protein [Streptomyces caniscabiei]MBE4767920.1 hypothetical protein [Streptomyces caniscabiei]MBE4784376.1 hypothetical protein [Streptomyces caniscabiei]MBE4791125.1 hypothetical protein [Streptomyces caniscabiei]